MEGLGEVVLYGGREAFTSHVKAKRVESMLLCSDAKFTKWVSSD